MRSINYIRISTSPLLALHNISKSFTSSKNHKYITNIKNINTSAVGFIKADTEDDIKRIVDNCLVDRNIDNVYIVGDAQASRLEDYYKDKNMLKSTFIEDKYSGEYKKIDYPFNSGEIPYLNLIGNLVSKATLRDTRNAKTISTFGTQLEFDLKKGFPLLTTKKMFWKGIIAELLFMLKGQTDSKILEKQGVNIWAPNTTQEFIQTRGLSYKAGDMGPMYGYLWRHFGYPYEGCSLSYKNKGYDQLLNVIQELINSPSSRRIMMTTFDPSQVDKSVLAPCHGLLTQFYVDEDNEGIRYLSCKMTQRSADIFLGLPFNIASYAALVHILCKITGYLPDKLIISLGDAHIYESHIEQCILQTSRLPYDFPTLQISKEYNSESMDPIEYIESLEFSDFTLDNYKHHPLIKAEMIA